MTNHITKFRSLDGLVLYDFRAYPDRSDYIIRHCVLPLKLSISESVFPGTSQIIKRAYRIHNEYFDSEKGMFVREYREEYRP